MASIDRRRPLVCTVNQQPVAGDALIDLGKPSEAVWLIATQGPLSAVTPVLAASQILLALADIRTKEDVVIDANPRILTGRLAVRRLLSLPVLVVALVVGVLADGAGTAAAANGVDLTFARVVFGDGTGHYGTGGSPQTGEYVLWVYDASGHLLNSATSAPADIDVPLGVGTTTLSVRGSYFPFNPVISSLANELTLSLNGSGGPDLVIDDGANSGTPQNPQVTSTTADGYTVSVSNFAFTERGQPDLVSPFTAFRGPWSNSTGSFTLTVTHVPTTTAQCKKNGWTTYTDASGTSFKNQGDCVSYVATGGRNPAAG